eukprot:TRINITY_DN8417_c0_g2_i2.p1 TRINITY_DN8417_c0_g2~~TRINITY_DN8417_c0_g2_i2.p1  ORF type:complete len:262 (+),score=102.59 TRINITY_DN8417_c0_g2_i2:81-866(+)
MLITPGRCSDEHHATGRRCFRGRDDADGHFLKRPESAPIPARPQFLHKNYETPQESQTWATRGTQRITEFSRSAKLGMWRRTVSARAEKDGPAAAGKRGAAQESKTPDHRYSLPPQPFAAFHRQVQSENEGLRYASLAGTYGIDMRDRKAYTPTSRAGWYSNETMFKPSATPTTPFSDILLANHNGLLAKTERLRHDKAARAKQKKKAAFEAKQDVLFRTDICAPQIALFEKKLQKWRRMNVSSADLPGSIETESVSSDEL